VKTSVLVVCAAVCPRTTLRRRIDSERGRTLSKLSRLLNNVFRVLCQRQSAGPEREREFLKVFTWLLKQYIETENRRLVAKLFCTSNFTEVVFKSMAYRLSIRECHFSFLVM